MNKAFNIVCATAELVQHKLKCDHSSESEYSPIVLESLSHYLQALCPFRQHQFPNQCTSVSAPHTASLRVAAMLSPPPAVLCAQSIVSAAVQEFISTGEGNYLFSATTGYLRFRNPFKNIMFLWPLRAREGLARGKPGLWAHAQQTET